MDATKKSANHSASVNVCRDVRGENYTAGGQECDEHPFQSTHEGSSTSTDNEPCKWHGSTWPINGRGGTELGGFYGLNRVLDKDAY
jgi:hypothetical protein